MAEQNDLFERLVDWVDGRLSPTEIEELQEVLKTAAPSATADLAWLRRFRTLSEQISLASPPAEVHQQLVESGEPQLQERRPPSFWQRLTASLSFDSGAQLAVAGVRSAGQLPERQLVYSTEIADIVLNIQPQPTTETLDLYGQIFPLDEEDERLFAVQLLSPQQEEVVTGAADELGEFRFAAVAAGAYQLILSSDDVELAINDLALAIS